MFGLLIVNLKKQPIINNILNGEDKWLDIDENEKYICQLSNEELLKAVRFIKDNVRIIQNFYLMNIPEINRDAIVRLSIYDKRAFREREDYHIRRLLMNIYNFAINQFVVESFVPKENPMKWLINKSKLVHRIMEEYKYRTNIGTIGKHEHITYNIREFINVEIEMEEMEEDYTSAHFSVDVDSDNTWGRPYNLNSSDGRVYHIVDEELEQVAVPSIETASVDRDEMLRIMREGLERERFQQFATQILARGEW